MKLKLLVKLGELLLGAGFSEDEPRADMYLPIGLLALALVLMVGGVALGVWAVAAAFLWAAVGAVGCILLGVVALLCWKNQTVRMVSDDSFEYTTFLGNKKVYRFDEIRGLRRNNDSMTLFVGDGKVHMENSARISPRFAQRVDMALARLDEAR